MIWVQRFMLSNYNYKLIFAFTFSALMSLPAAAQQPDQANLAARLRSSSPEERYQVVREVFEISPRDRNESLWVALADELQRLGTETHARDDAASAGREVPLLRYDPDYYYAVAKAVSQWRDPRALPALITSAGRGMVVLQGIVQFRETAVAPLIQAVRSGHTDERGGALIALRILLEGVLVEPYNIPPTPLSSAVREQIVQLARELLKSKTLEWGQIPTLADLALATGDEELRQQIQSLAISPVMIMQLSGLSDIAHILQLENAIQAQLKKRGY